nr:MoaF N-terminal domain-containing protein [uncultured Porphyromonas sp.]
MRRLFSSLALALGLCSCHSPTGTSTEQQPTVEPGGTLTDTVAAEPPQSSDTTLVGKRLYFAFDGNSSVVEYLSDRHLHWLSRDSVHGEKEGEDRYHAQHIESHIFFVNWVEADGTTISQVLDLKERTCQAFINSNVYARNRRGRQTVVLSGRITKIEDASHILLE